MSVRAILSKMCTVLSRIPLSYFV